MGGVVLGEEFVDFCLGCYYLYSFFIKVGLVSIVGKFGSCVCLLKLGFLVVVVIIRNSVSREEDIGYCVVGRDFSFLWCFKFYY